MIKKDRIEILEAFDHLLGKFYTMVGVYAVEQPKDDQIKGLINVAWTSIQACGNQVKQAVDAGQSVTEIELIIFRFEQQLDALDPLHPFVPSEKL
ncbi:hypothetical protein HN748_04730 [Candidatus Peregrinibacteria bacterium]|nr:hypothetical protein [Candidatus Peregrinibacteria bacterium]MBT7484078.1 hypothetical protein [Candidatus Peregrinibacteria bacterium]MBT7703515.1 hypothetical protein [Candidatus Peregrinibacteria bacterium]